MTENKTQHALNPDLDQAQRFLETLDAGTVFTFQTFDDNAERKDFRLAKVLHGTLAQHQAHLTTLQQQGAGVFVMVNEGDGLIHEGSKTCRTAANVIRVRAHVLDLDGAPIQPVLDCGLPPHILVESSPGKWHVYWKVLDCPLEDYKLRQKALAARFDGDPAVCDLPRVLRVPGFWHQKNQPFMTRMVDPAGSDDASTINQDKE